MFFETVSLWIVQQDAVNDFQSQQFVNLGSVVSDSFKVSLYHSLERSSFYVRPGKGTRVEQHIANIAG